MTCSAKFAACKRASETKPYGFRWTDAFCRRWQADTPFATGVRVRPTLAALRSGFEFESSGGQSNGKKEPKWPTALGETVQDGSITWTAVALSVNGLLERVSAVAWVAPVGITVNPRVAVDEAGLQETLADISGGTSGTTYEIRADVTTTIGNIYAGVIELEVQ